jgi:hypothetical protein
MWRTLPVCLVCAGAIAGAAASVRQSPQPQTVLSLPAPIEAFAQGSGRMAWMVPDDACGVLVRARPIAGGPVTTLTPPKGETCQGNLDSPLGPGDLVLAGTHAMWTTYSASNEEDDATVTLGVPGRNDVELGLVGWEGGIDAGNHTVPSVPMAGAGSSLVWADVGTVLGRGELYRGVSNSCCRVGTVNGVRALAVDGNRIAVALTTPAGSALTDEPSWSSKGPIAFASFRDGNWGIYTVSTSGGAWHLVTESVDVGVGEPAWSPDGKRLAFVHDSDIWETNADGSGSRQLTHGGLASSPEWMPDGKRIVFIDPDGISMVDQGGGIRRLVKGSSFGYELENAAVSPDGTKLAFYDDSKDKLYVARLDGSDRKAIGDESDPAWSPDGTEIATSTCRITISAPDGSGAHPITKPPGKLCDLHPSWSADGSSIVFSRGQSDSSGDLYVVHADGTGLRRLTTTVPVPAKDEAEVVTGAGHAVGKVESVSASDVALSGPTLVFATAAGFEVHDVASGRLVRTIHASGTSLSLSGRRLVYVSGRAIKLADTSTGAVSTLVVLPSFPIGLSIRGSRVTWAESGARTARIRTISLTS